jgi:hypothetical protein
MGGESGRDGGNIERKSSEVNTRAVLIPGAQRKGAGSHDHESTTRRSHQ